MRVICRAFATVVMIVCLLPLPVAARRSPQIGQAPAPYGQGAGPVPHRDNRTTDPMDEGLDRSIRFRLEEARKVERKRRMVDDANRLVQLTEQFQKDTAGRAKLTEADVKRLDEIAKLARSVKDRMRE